MRIDAGVAGSPSQVLVFPVGNVRPGPVVPVLLGQAEVDEKELVAVTTDAHQEVVRLDVPVDEVLVVNKLDPPDHLVGQHENRLHGEAPGAEVEEVFERGSEEVHDEDVVVALRSVPPDVGDPDAPLEDLVELGLVQELRMPGLD